MWRAATVSLLAAVSLNGLSACRSACFDPDKPACVERYDGSWLVAHRLRNGLEDRDIRETAIERAPALSARGDGALGVQWTIARVDETWVLGFPDAGAVGLTPLPRGEGTCSASTPRVMSYVPDDTLDRQPRLQVQVTACAGTPTTSDVLFVGPSDFGREILAWEREESFDLWVAAPLEGLGRGAVFRFTDAPNRAETARTFGDAQMLEGEAAGDHLGQILRRCGDLDGDGFDELAIGIPGLTLDGAERAGGVAIFTPETLPAEGDLSLDNADALLTGTSEDRAATDVLCNVDLTGDGRPDLVVGAPGANAGDLEDNGSVWIVAGEDVRTGSLSDRARVAWHGGADGEQLGSSVAAGDLDGDGAVDLAAGAPGSDANGEGSGGIRAWYADPSEPLPPPGPLFAGRVGRPVDGVEASPRLGRRVAIADLDDDGQAELIGAAWRADRDGLRLHAGEIVGWTGELVREGFGGTEVDVAFVISGSASHQETGRTLIVEDIDNDGAIDIVTGARRRAQ